jgi:hypothetical protein
MPRFTPLTVAALALLFMIQPLATQSKKHDKEEMKKKKFHEGLVLEYPDEKGKWFDLDKRGLGIKFKGEGVVLFVYGNFWEAPSGGTQGVLTLNGKKVPTQNTSTVVKEFLKMHKDGFKKVYKTGKNKKFKSKAGKGLYSEIVASEPESKESRNIIQIFTSTAAGVDVSRSFNPRTVKAHIRFTTIKQRAGVHYLMIMANDDVLKKHRREIDKVLKRFTTE